MLIFYQNFIFFISIFLPYIFMYIWALHIYYSFKFSAFMDSWVCKEWFSVGVSLSLMVHWLPIGKDRKQNWQTGLSTVSEHNIHTFSGESYRKIAWLYFRVRGKLYRMKTAAGASHNLHVMVPFYFTTGIQISSYHIWQHGPIIWLEHNT